MKERPDRKLNRRRFLAWSVRGLCVAAGIKAYAEPYDLRLERRDIPIRGLSPALDGYRIAVISDIHYPRQISAEYVRGAVALANQFQPDLLALPGDFTDHKGSATVPAMRDLFGEARARDGVVGVLGNHDHWLDAEGVRRELHAHTPVRLLENQHFIVERRDAGLAIGGVGDLWEGVVDPDRAFAGVAPDMPRILLAHNPDFAEDMTASVRVDLQISGHTHGGEGVVLGHAPFVPSRYGNKFRQGLVQGKVNRVYVTRGICAIRRVRFFCPPEVSALTLRTHDAPFP
jgi:predicted MPP superfamily phosphohydrolase